MKTTSVLLLMTALTTLLGCALRPSSPPAPEHLAKIELDLSTLDVDGLAGPPGAKTSVAYEFAIPDTAACREEVRAIDPSVQISKSRGRIGAMADQCLCIGETHQANHIGILYRLAALPYVERIVPCYFE